LDQLLADRKDPGIDVSQAVPASPDKPGDHRLPCQRPYFYVKRFLDVCGALFMTALLSPLLLYIVIRLLLESGWPVLFTQKRLGYKGRIFNMFKFRTLRRPPTDEDDAGSHMSLEGQDEDITPFGAWLRKSALNELPQIFNVLIGDMSFIGPRPAVLAHEQYYTDWHRKRLEALPGIVGLAQVCGRNLIPWGWRVALDRYYIEHFGVALDKEVFIKTTGVVLGRKGAEGTDMDLYFDFTPPGPEVVETLEREGIQKCFLDSGQFEPRLKDEP
jgi:lipopolysaccharide/colanic/teichoic acid biosynthesis glycosyltransferase